MAIQQHVSLRTPAFTLPCPHSDPWATQLTQAGVLSGERDKKIQDLLLLDVTPLTLGIETTGGVMAAIIPRNTVVPTSKTKRCRCTCLPQAHPTLSMTSQPSMAIMLARYTTAEDNQVAVSNKVYEGERSLSKDNRHLGTFELSGFPPMRKGEAQIDVTFDLVSLLITAYS